jgi:hypothetical protein
MQIRRSFRQHLSLQDRLSAWASQAREQANKLRPGAEQDTLLKKARQADVASHLDEWINSPGLQQPK